MTVAWGGADCNAIAFCGESGDLGGEERSGEVLEVRAAASPGVAALDIARGPHPTAISSQSTDEGRCVVRCAADECDLYAGVISTVLGRVDGGLVRQVRVEVTIASPIDPKRGAGDAKQ